jgi:hypothetical protein
MSCGPAITAHGSLDLKQEIQNSNELARRICTKYDRLNLLYITCISNCSSYNSLLFIFFFILFLWTLNNFMGNYVQLFNDQRMMITFLQLIFVCGRSLSLFPFFFPFIVYFIVITQVWNCKRTSECVFVQIFHKMFSYLLFMKMCVCMYVMYVCVCVCVYVCVCVCLSVCVLFLFTTELLRAKAL